MLKRARPPQFDALHQPPPPQKPRVFNYVVLQPNIETTREEQGLSPANSALDFDTTGYSQQTIGGLKKIAYLFQDRPYTCVELVAKTGMKIEHVRNLIQVLCANKQLVQIGKIYVSHPPDLRSVYATPSQAQAWDRQRASVLWGDCQFLTNDEIVTPLDQLPPAPEPSTHMSRWTLSPDADIPSVLFTKHTDASHKFHMFVPIPIIPFPASTQKASNSDLPLDRTNILLNFDTSGYNDQTLKYFEEILESCQKKPCTYRDLEEELGVHISTVRKVCYTLHENKHLVHIGTVRSENGHDAYVYATPECAQTWNQSRAYQLWGRRAFWINDEGIAAQTERQERIIALCDEVALTSNQISQHLEVSEEEAGALVHYLRCAGKLIPYGMAQWVTPRLSEFLATQTISLAMLAPGSRVGGQ